MRHHQRRQIIILPLWVLLLTLSMGLPSSAQEIIQEPTQETEIAVTEEQPSQTAEVTPTGEATDLPTETPTGEITAEPTAEATSEATDIPTQAPTAETTMEPTDEVTAEPTQAPVSAPPIFNLAATPLEAAPGVPLEIRLSVSDDLGMARISEDVSATLGGVSVVASAPVESAAPFNTEVVITYLAPADYVGTDSFSLTALDTTGETASVTLTVNVKAAQAEATPEVTEVPDRLLAAATYTVNNKTDDSDETPGDGVCDTNGMTAGSQCSLRAALEQANANDGFTDIIRFAIPGASPAVITPGSSLPVINDPVIIQGTLGGVVLNGGGTIDNGLTIVADGAGSRISGLVINGFNQNGILLRDTQRNIIAGNYLGIDASGTKAAGNFNGVALVNSSDNLIGGDSAAERNVISGNGVGFGGYGTGVYVSLGSNNIIQGNYIGTDKTGRLDVGNVGSGIYTTSTRLLSIGGDMIAERNIISGNQYGVYLNVTSNSDVSGNYIGTNAAGTAAIANDEGGLVLANDSNENIIGTLTLSNRIVNRGNLISGNKGSGLSIQSSSGNLVSGNFIGTNAAGTAALANGGDGIALIYNASNNRIGGDQAGLRNLISGNSSSGIYIGSGAKNTVIIGNYIGTDKTGRKALMNGVDGITITSSIQRIGGQKPGEGNVIAFNSDYGVHMVGATQDVEITRNSIFGNGNLGIKLDPGANNSIKPGVSLITFVTPTRIDFTVSGTSGGRYRIEFFTTPTCNLYPNADGQTFIGEANIDSFDTLPKTFYLSNINPPLTPGHFMTATVTNLVGGIDTSEFSSCSALTTGVPTARPRNIAPANNTVLFGNKPVFEWGAIPMSSYYQGGICTDSQCANLVGPVRSVPLMLKSIYQFSLPNGVYYWKIRGYSNDLSNPGPWSTPTKFTIDTDSQPGLSRPADDSFTPDTSPTFTWLRQTGAVGYELAWNADAGSGLTCNQIRGTSGTKKIVTNRTSYTLQPNDGLLPEGVTSWCVVGVDVQGNLSQGSEVWHVGVSLLQTPLNDSPVADTTPTFTWKRAPGTNVLYTLTIDDTPDLSSPILNKSGLTSTRYTLTTAEALEVGKTYYWAIEANNANWPVNERVVGRFVVVGARPAAPALLTPLNGARDVNPVDVVFDWNPVASVNGARINYELWMANDPGFTNAEIYIAGTDTTVVGDTLTGRVYWKVRARYNSGAAYGPFSQTRNFIALAP